MESRTTPANVTSLKPWQIFVFPSNLSGRHGAGAAKQAVIFGAIYGRGTGPQGATYAIPTKGYSAPGNFNAPVLSLESIRDYIIGFIWYAAERPNLEFLVTPIGCGFAGYTPEQIVPLFELALHIDNIYLPAEFWAVLTPRKL